jgi:hypothetical protein
LVIVDPFTVHDENRGVEIGDPFNYSSDRVELLVFSRRFIPSWPASSSGSESVYCFGPSSLHDSRFASEH